MQSNNDQINQELIQFLRQDELNYPAGADKFGAEALPLLQELIKSDDENLASKAAYLAGYIKDEGRHRVLAEAATNKFAPVRIAAAFGARKLKSTSASEILQTVMADNDAGVLKAAMKSVQDLKVTDQFKTRLKKISTLHQDDLIRQTAKKLIKP